MQRRTQDPGLQPERTSLAWFRTLLGYSALLAQALRHSLPFAGWIFCLVFMGCSAAAMVIYYYARQRNLMDTAAGDITAACAVRAKWLIALAVGGLALLFAASHLRQLVLLWRITE